MAHLRLATLVVGLILSLLIRIDARANSRYYYSSENDDQEATISFAALSSSGELSRARPSQDTYFADREAFMRQEQAQMIGADIELNEREQLANDVIMAIKKKEYDDGMIAPRLFSPSKHIFSVLAEIRASPLFAYMQAMPKGAALHAHDTALVSTEFIITLTYRPDLWVCETNGGREAYALRFSKSRPTIVVEGGESCSWTLLSEVRSNLGDKSVDEYLSERLTLYPKQKYEDNNEAWQDFMSIFGLLDGLVTYAPVWADYYYTALEEFLADGVQYLEFRSTLPLLYDLEGTEFTALDTVRVYKETLERFMKDHPDFIGSKLIYAPIRNTDTEGFAEYVRTCLAIKEQYPDFLAGFDLVGQEEPGRPLKYFIPQLLQMPDTIDFFFHAGETNWYGSEVDENLIDALLLGTKRIGHGFALVKHPAVLEQLKSRKIAIEVNPVSNQVLQLVSDYRNHPCSHFFANNYPVVISCDDPSFWKSTPLSHDYYIAFLGIASAHHDLRLLKKLALNSLEYSSLSDEQKVVARQKWQTKWDAYVEQVIKGLGSNAGSNSRSRSD